MSERQDIQHELEKFISEVKDGRGNPKFDAPYGVISGMDPMGRGFMRTIAFGVSRYLDATIKIITPKNITISGQGGLARKYSGTFRSVEEVKTILRS
jgi:hypothetical protein